MRRALVVFGLGAVLLTASDLARAQARCAIDLDSSPALGAVDPAARLAFIRATMRDQARRARLWMWGWGIGGTALSAGNYVLAGLAKTKDDAIDPLVSGTTSLFIPGAILVKPLRVSSDADALEDYLAVTTTSLGGMEPCAQIARAEELLAASADDEALGVGLFAHAFAVVGNGAVALFLGLGFKHWTGALVNGVGGFLITEGQILTQPSGAIDALARYRRGDLDPRATAITWSLAPLAIGDARGIAVVGAF